MIRVLLDTNVLATGLAGLDVPASTPGALLRHWRAGRLELVVSTHILAGLERTLAKPYFTSRRSVIQIAAAIEEVAREAIIATPQGAVSGLASHPADDFVLDAAVSAGAAYVVTGDGLFSDWASSRVSPSSRRAGF